MISASALRLHLLLFAGLIASLDAIAASIATVKTDRGTVQGISDGAVTVFKGVPFAAPPVGHLRWRPPQPAAAWRGTYKADHFKPMCMTTIPAIPGGVMESVSEDCLYLNIWTPSRPSLAMLPVIVWIYGGGMRGGSSSTPTYWGDQLIKKGVITVNLSYRVGSLGFLAHPELSRESAHHVSGNYGILDMIAALEWVQQNIAAFGGDPNNVTIFGQSAGSFGVGYLTTSPLAHGLFHRAIGQSSADMGPAGTVAGMMSRQDAEASGLRLATALGAKSVQEMRRVAAEKIVKADSTQWPTDSNGKFKAGTTAVPDGYVLPMDMYGTFAAGKQNDVPLLIGYNANEGGDILWEPLKAAAYELSVKEQYADLAAKILDLYPAPSEAAAAQSQMNLLRDNWFGWHMWTWARLQASTGNSKVFFYHFDYAQPVPADSDLAGVGAAHGFELAYVFAHPDQLPVTASAADKRVVETVSTYWSNFAKTGNPNGSGVPTWPAFNTTDQQVLRIADPMQVSAIPDQPGLKLQDEYMEKLRTSRLTKAIMEKRP